MKQFQYIIQDAMGIHTRPAGLLVKLAASFASKVQISCDNTKKSADCKRLFAVMGLSVKTGQAVTVSVEGSDEEAAFAALEVFFAETL